MIAGRLFRSFSFALRSRLSFDTPGSTMATHSLAGTHLQPREFPTTGFEVIDPSQKVEEERLPCYDRDEYYPMRIGEVIHGRYQAVAKLGYGVTSTVWLSRDLRYFLFTSHYNGETLTKWLMAFGCYLTEMGNTGRSRSILIL